MGESGLKDKTVVIGTIGFDCHIIGIWVIGYALQEQQVKVINLGACVSQEEFISAAIETSADAIAISSTCGHALLDAQGFKEKCQEAGLKNTPLYIGGNLAVGEQSWEEVEKQFLELGFDRAYSTKATPETFIQDLSKDIKLAAKHG